MTRIPAHLTATIAHARIDDVLRESRSRALVGQVPGSPHRVPRLRPAWWTRLATSQLRRVELA